MVILVSIIVIAIALVGILGMALRAGDKAPAVGSEAPDFTLNSQDGKPVSLHDYKGKWVVLYFYPKDMTSGCTIEAHNFERDLTKYDARNAVILGVSMQGEKSHQDFCAKTLLLAQNSEQQMFCANVLHTGGFHASWRNSLVCPWVRA